MTLFNLILWGGDGECVTPVLVRSLYTVMFPVCKAPGPHSSTSEEFLHSIILRPLGS